jgi:hypothetical protein
MNTEYKNPEWPKHPQVYDRCMKQASEADSNYGLYYKTCMIHLADAVEQGTISPMEAYDALYADYFPEWLKVRKSRYSHLL